MTKKVFPLELTKSTEELKKLIAEHPDYPIVVLAGECANSGDFAWMYCASISFGIEEILDCETPYENCVCSSCDMWNKRRSDFCPSCGKAMTPEAWIMLEKRLREIAE